MSKTLNVSIIGATGFTGLELIRLLSNHPHIALKHLTSTSHAGTKMSELWPHLQGICDLTLVDTSPEIIANESDIIFVALPHGQSQFIMPQIIDKAIVIDLGSDFRLKNSDAYQNFYKHDHRHPALLDSFTYGIPEFFAADIAQSKAITNPGCFAITAQLALYPIRQLIEHVSIVAMTGSSGSGKSPSAGAHHPIRNHNVKSYKIGTHQHLGEIVQTTGLHQDQIAFVPTSGPFTRGIHLTASLKAKSGQSIDDVTHIFEKQYSDCPWVRLKNNVQLADVIGSNFCDIALHDTGDLIVVQAVIDNLMKGAAGTAVQNMNLACGWDQSIGLSTTLPLFP